MNDPGSCAQLAPFHQLSQELSRLDAESFSELNDDRESGHVVAAFDEAEVTGVHLGALCQLFLSPASRFAQFPYDGPE